jgi:hypothetical protein
MNLWFQKSNHLRIVKKTQIGSMTVSTVFLGMDHNFHQKGQPILFETMIFEGPHDQEYQRRCSSYEYALLMHQEGIKQAEEWLKS